MLSFGNLNKFKLLESQNELLESMISQLNHDFSKVSIHLGFKQNASPEQIIKITQNGLLEAVRKNQLPQLLYLIDISEHTIMNHSHDMNSITFEVLKRIW